MADKLSDARKIVNMLLEDESGMVEAMHEEGELYPEGLGYVDPSLQQDPLMASTPIASPESEVSPSESLPRTAYSAYSEDVGAHYNPETGKTWEGGGQIIPGQGTTRESFKILQENPHMATLDVRNMSYEEWMAEDQWRDKDKFVTDEQLGTGQAVSDLITMAMAAPVYGGALGFGPTPKIIKGLKKYIEGTAKTPRTLPKMTPDPKLLDKFRDAIGIHSGRRKYLDPRTGKYTSHRPAPKVDKQGKPIKGIERDWRQGELNPRLLEQAKQWEMITKSPALRKLLKAEKANRR